ncbi:DUF5666 domain-containing protein [Nocardioides sp. W7]|uniref:DUF5666 domain-containing protein n=1 Tax=Nocardioides sp. W7 TaxID=2931390 RepID=UPI001FD0EA7E|nr:DUF5666 domain-containing protein [Nocardioides sp. W7]
MKVSRITRGTACSALLIATLAACGGDSEPATDTGAAESPAAAQAGGPGAGGPGSGGPGGGGMPGSPGTSGTIAAVSGKTLQVQSASSGQVAVSWTADTAFLEQVAGSLDDVTVGSCVMVTSDGETADGEPVAATAVRITEAVDGECAGGFGGGGPGGARPEGMPTDMPTDLPDGGRRGFGVAFGEVTAVSGTGFTVESTDSSVEVTVTDATTYSSTVEADAAAVEVGRCAMAVGEADDTGAVTATRISLSDPVDGECASGRGPGGSPAQGDAS